MLPTVSEADWAKEKIMTLIAAAVTQSTPLPTVLFLEMASTEASDQPAFSVLAAAFPISPVTPLKIQGNSSASAVTEDKRQTMAPGMLLLKKNETIAASVSAKPA